MNEQLTFDRCDNCDHPTNFNRTLTIPEIANIFNEIKDCDCKCHL